MTCCTKILSYWTWLAVTVARYETWYTTFIMTIAIDRYLSYETLKSVQTSLSCTNITSASRMCTNYAYPWDTNQSTFFRPARQLLILINNLQSDCASLSTSSASESVDLETSSLFFFFLSFTLSCLALPATASSVHFGLSVRFLCNARNSWNSGSLLIYCSMN